MFLTWDYKEKKNSLREVEENNDYDLYSFWLQLVEDGCFPAVVKPNAENFGHLLLDPQPPQHAVKEPHRPLGSPFPQKGRPGF